MEYPLTPEALADEVCGALADAVELSSHAPFTVALSGGSTPKKLYEAMAMSPLIDWSKLEFFFDDERAVPPEHSDSNYGMVMKAFAGVKARVHRMEAEHGHAASYEELLRNRVVEKRDGVPVLDLVLLGVGPDGHTASLFPGAPELELTSRLVTMTAQPHLGHGRMTLTLPVLNAARRVWVLAAGDEKADIVAQVKGRDGPLPIQQVKPTAGELRWWLDKKAASKL